MEVRIWVVVDQMTIVLWVEFQRERVKLEPVTKVKISISKITLAIRSTLEGQLNK